MPGILKPRRRHSATTGGHFLKKHSLFPAHSQTFIQLKTCTVHKGRRRGSRYIENPPRKETRSVHVKRDSWNRKRAGLAEPQTPRKSLRNQEARGGVSVTVRLTESTCCLGSLNIRNTAAVEAENGRVGVRTPTPTPTHGPHKAVLRAAQRWQPTYRRPPKQQEMCSV